jgi:hypothetical protein
MKKRNIQEQDHLMKNMAPRRLSTPWILQRFPLFNSKLEKILARSLREEQEQEKERGKSGRREILA